MTVGYFIPAFPGQTHTFFWRDVCAAERLGLSIDIVSTRRPGSAEACHSWVGQAVERTEYLFPARARTVLGGMIELLRAGPRGWGRTIAAIARAEGYSHLGRLRLLPDVLFGAQLAWLARSRGWCHCHVHKCTEAANIAMFAHLLSGLSYSLTLHNVLSADGPNQKQKWRHAKFATVVSQALFSEVKEKLDGSLPPVVEVAPMGVDVDVFKRRAPYEPWQGEGPCRVFSCGRLNPAKGHGDMIKAVALLRQQGLDVRLRIAGGARPGRDDLRADIERQITEAGLEEAITLLGRIPEEAIRDELEHTHIFALASHSEGVPVSVMEAMAMEVPVVVTRVGGVPDLVDDGLNGLLAEPRNPEQLASIVAGVFRDGALAQRLGGAGRQKVAQGFHSGIGAQAILRCLEQTGGRPNVCSPPARSLRSRSAGSCSSFGRSAGES